MYAFTSALINIAIFVLLAVPGFILVKANLVSEQTSGILSKVLVLVGMPFLIVKGTLRITFDTQSLIVIGISALVGIAYHFFLIYTSKFVAGQRLGEKNTGVSRFSIIFSNNGFLGMPLALAICANEPLVFTSVVVINIITNILMQTLGVSIISCEKKKFSFKIFLNPLIIAFVIGMAINLSGLLKYVPQVNDYTNHLAGIVTPLSMLILGMQLGKADVKKLFSTAKMYYISAMKLVVVPVIIVGILLVIRIFATGLSSELIKGVFFAFAMPTAGLASAYATMYDGDVENAVYYTMGSTILAVATIPILYLILTLLL